MFSYRSNLTVADYGDEVSDSEGCLVVDRAETSEREQLRLATDAEKNSGKKSKQRAVMTGHQR